ncbi:similar to SR family splicing factor SC35 [Cyanidioschyzon merolae strain 10D]|jgi:RNA recognition motif-containing protein|uniref:Similar to SR family splicing factor SC35 n=1 Tax=Cyanidioschyzon merolae (strain NIES-3377 / 10D) TaxID=280699 RepID=M1V5J9_CYAM1|nr:similar to SR family splicing factor SC35 [Cyanidioschyzon merolae strain 10D]BAM80800.1 similar to SR family splicing factor SC35 [Cyanidioschyzon merolae strain 10D]|eukprot:XP_005536836.1 similar to SR family splicing factor SC35 [Cyanidioschyzon merolae strain 10D]
MSGNEALSSAPPSSTGDGAHGGDSLSHTAKDSPSGATLIGETTEQGAAKPKSSRPFPNRPSESELQNSVGLMVRNIPFGTRQEDLLELFRPYGDVIDIFIPWDRQLRRIRGFAFVRLQTLEQAEAAIAALDGSTMRERIIAVKRAEYERGEGPVSQHAGASDGRRGQSRRPRRSDGRSTRRRRPRSRSFEGGNT